MRRKWLTFPIERPLLWLGLWVFVAAIFAADTVTDREIAFAVLYVAVILIAAQSGRTRLIASIGVGCAVLTVVSYVLTTHGDRQSGLVNGALSLLAIATTTFLAIRNETTEARARQALADLAHMARVTTMGELTASIAHEVSQPLAGIVANGHAALRWLDASPPSPDEARRALGRVVTDADRAGEVIGRVRRLVTKSPPSRDRVDLAGLIDEALVLARTELRRNRVVLRTDYGADLPPPLVDRVQLQQVILNLVVNAAETMGGLETGPRDLLVSAAADASKITVSIRDTGVSLAPVAIAQVFEAFYTTRPGGMGMGLAISRSIVEAHGGTIYAALNHPRGMVFGFTLPLNMTRTA
ncbi:C4-dicarboxylate-specific signal transduction histidine kinase [Bosea sp. BE125]|uniref:sensor histidine kinase n=1 Tax=Bosea sp. BE125 TaxID=2817909 RepID=UPI00285D6F77|nr:ATP-binding protein [Bosea sp. BE125]MDR6873661.1 C4-dicarboxylate-specific signal transduction histidine kinase [Bosea sp. BE125]